MNHDAIYNAVVAEWERWPETKHITDEFGFKDLLRAEYGFTMNGTNRATFSYKVVDEKKFMWFCLGGRIHDGK